MLRRQGEGIAFAYVITKQRLCCAIMQPRMATCWPTTAASNQRLCRYHQPYTTTTGMHHASPLSCEPLPSGCFDSAVVSNKEVGPQASAGTERRHPLSRSLCVLSSESIAFSENKTHCDGRLFSKSDRL